MKQTTTNKPKSTRGNSSSAETAENFSFGSGSVYGDVADYVSENRTFDVLAITFETGRGYEGRDRWALTVKVGGSRTRDSHPRLESQPRRAAAFRAGSPRRGGTIKNKRLRMSGNAYYLVDADR